MSVPLNAFMNKKGQYRYIKIKTFPENISLELYDAIKANKLFFDDISGSLQYDNTILINPLTKKQPFNNSGNKINYNNKNFIFSKNNGSWVLNITTPYKISLHYNPLPRQEMIRYYETITDKNQINNTIIDACVETQGSDPICSCMNKDDANGIDTEFCMNDIFSGDSALRKQVKMSKNKVAYGQLASVCRCVNLNCNKDHPLIKPNTDCSNNINIVMCNSNIGSNSGSGSSTISGNQDIVQNCKNDISQIDEVPTPTPPTPTPPTPTPPTPTPPTPTPPTPTPPTPTPPTPTPPTPTPPTPTPPTPTPPTPKSKIFLNFVEKYYRIFLFMGLLFIFAGLLIKRR